MAEILRQNKKAARGDFDLFTTCFCAVGGGKRDRTADLLHAMQALSQLSYTPRAQKHCYYFLLPTTPDRTGVPKGIRTPVLTVKG